MNTLAVSPHVSPLVKYEIKRHKNLWSRITLDISGVRKVIFGQIQTDHGSKSSILVFNHPSGIIDINNKNIATIEPGFHIWEEVIRHKNDNIVGSYYHEHSNGGVHIMVKWGALHPKVGKLVKYDNGGREFEKLTEPIKAVVTI